MKEISYEFAKYNGVLPDSLEKAYKSVEGCSILSPATDRAFELAYRIAEKENRRIEFVVFRGETLKIV